MNLLRKLTLPLDWSDVRNVKDMKIGTGIIPSGIEPIINSDTKYKLKDIKFEKIPLAMGLLLNRYNPIIVKTLLDAISPYWDTCLKNPILFKILFKVFFSFYSLGIIRPLLGQTIR
jgi:hypothetical protein